MIARNHGIATCADQTRLSQSVQILLHLATMPTPREGNLTKSLERAAFELQTRLANPKFWHSCVTTTTASIPCKSERQALLAERRWNALTSAEKATALGLTITPPPPQLQRILDQLSPTLLHQLALHPRPVPFPTSGHPMDPLQAERTAQSGRRFEVAEHSFKFMSCGCCGINKPAFQATKLVSVRMKHLPPVPTYIMYRCDKPNCLCRPGFFTGRDAQDHDEADLTEVALCKACHTDKGLNPDTPAHLRWSKLNLMGPIPPLPEALSDLSYAEEGAIRRIAPLISFQALRYGGTAVKGNTSCVHRTSKLGNILPNLPEDCYMFVLRAKRRMGQGTVSMKCRRHKIQAALLYLKASGHPAWADIEIDLHNLNSSRPVRWPQPFLEEGSLLIR